MHGPLRAAVNKENWPISKGTLIQRYYKEFLKFINPLPVQFKSLLPGQEGFIFFSGPLNTRTCHYVLLRSGRQRVKSISFEELNDEGN
jgi:hypothetical protein